MSVKNIMFLVNYPSVIIFPILDKCLRQEV